MALPLHVSFKAPLLFRNLVLSMTSTAELLGSGPSAGPYSRQCQRCQWMASFRSLQSSAFRYHDFVET
jgi:hypothetical protein